MELGPGFHQGAGEGAGCFHGLLQQMKGQALGGSGTDAGKLFQLVEKALKGGGVFSQIEVPFEL
jgi:hypothetical protein